MIIMSKIFYLGITLLFSSLYTFAQVKIEDGKEGFGQQKRFDEPTSAWKLMFVPDSLKTPEQIKYDSKSRRVYHTNIKFRGDSITFLLDKDAYLAEGLTEESYLDEMEVLSQFNELCRKSKPEIRQRLLSTEATHNAVYLKFLGLEYSGDVQLLEYERIKFTGPGGSPSIVNMKNSISFIPSFPACFFVIPKDYWNVISPSATIDSVKVISKH